MSGILEGGTNWGVLFLRLGAGLVFLAHGYPKLSGRGGDFKGSRESLTQSIHRLGLSFPYYLAIVVGAIEFFGGLMLLLGLWTRWAAIALAVIMVVASGRNFVQKGFLHSADFPFSLLTGLLALILLGSGSISLDSLLTRF